MREERDALSSRLTEVLAELQEKVGALDDARYSIEAMRKELIVAISAGSGSGPGEVLALTSPTGGVEERWLVSATSTPAGVSVSQSIVNVSNASMMGSPQTSHVRQSMTSQHISASFTSPTSAGAAVASSANNSTVKASRDAEFNKILGEKDASIREVCREIAAKLRYFEKNIEHDRQSLESDVDQYLGNFESRLDVAAENILFATDTNRRIDDANVSNRKDIMRLLDDERRERRDIELKISLYEAEIEGLELELRKANDRAAQNDIIPIGS